MGTDLKIGSSTLKDVPENLATAISVEYKALQAENSRLDSEIRNLKDSRSDMASYELDGKTYTDMGEMYKDMKSMHKKYKDMMSKYEDMKGKHDILDTQLRERSDSLSPESIVKMRRDDRALEKIARDHLPDYSEERFDSMTPIEVKKAIINGAGVNADNYAESAFDGMIELIAKTSQSRSDNYQKQKQYFATDSTDSNDRYTVDSYFAELDRETNNRIENAWREVVQR